MPNRTRCGGLTEAWRISWMAYEHYAASCRWVRRGNRTLLEAWSHVLAVGQPLPTLPLWLNEDLVVPLDLERSYEQARNDLWIA